MQRRHLLAAGGGLILPAAAAHAQAAVQLRIGSVVPKNSLYHQKLLEIGEAWRGAARRGGQGSFIGHLRSGGNPPGGQSSIRSRSAKERVDGRWPLQRADRRPDPLSHREARA